MPIIGLGQLTLTDLNDAIVSGTAPSNPTVGALWIDTSVTPSLLKKWDGNVWTVIGEVSEEGTGETVSDITETLGNMANDGILNFQERQVIKDKLMEIIGYVLADNALTLPVVATLDADKRGSFYSVRNSALSAGLESDTPEYVAVATKYDALRSYLVGMTPIKPWNLLSADSDKNITVDKPVFRTKWLEYYEAEQKLAEATTKKLKDNVDDVDVGGKNMILESNTSVTTTTYLIKEYTLTENWVENDEYTFVVKGSIPAGQKFGVWMNRGALNVGYATEEYRSGIYYVTFKAKAPTSGNEKILGLYNSPNNTTSASIEWVALYKGNKPMDWSPAPEDIDSKFSSQFTQTKDMIDLKVSKDDVINSVNVSGEGIRIQGKKIQIDGNTVFASGYDPTEIKVGGANLIDNSKGNTLAGWALWTGNSGYITSVNGSSWIRAYNTNTTGGTTVTAIHTPRFYMKANVTYVVSFDIRSYYNLGYDLNYIYLRDSTTIKKLSNVDMRASSGFVGDLGVGGLRVWFTFSHDVDVPDARLLIGASLSDGAGFIIKEVMVEEGNKPSSWRPSTNDVQSQIDNINSEISDVNTAVSNLDTYVDGAFKDGVISEAEAKSIEKYINQINAEKADVDNKYNSIYSRPELSGASERSALNVAKTNYNSAHSSLLTAINSAISDGKTTSTEKSNVDSKFATYQTRLGELSTAFENAVNKISQGKVDNVSVGGRNLLHKELMFINTSSVTVLDESRYFSNGELTISKPSATKFSGIRYGGVALEPNTEYVFSFKMQKTAGNLYTIGGHIDSAYSNKISFTINGVEQGTFNQSNRDTSLNNASLIHDVIYKFKTPSTINNEDYLYIQPNRGQDESVTVIISSIKLEKGNKRTDWALSPEDSKLYVDSVEVGGTNIMTDSLLNSYLSSNATVVKTEGDYNQLKLTWNGNSSYFGYQQNSANRKTKYQEGQKYTLSFDIRGNVNNMNYTYFMRTDGANRSVGAIPVSLSTTEWKRVSVQHISTWTTEQGYILIGSTDTSSGKWFEIRKVQIEKGDKATDYSPNPMDTINPDGTVNTDKLKGTITDSQISSALNWNNAKSLLDSWKSGTTLINGQMIATGTIFTKQLAVGDFENLATVSENNPDSMSSDSSAGRTRIVAGSKDWVAGLTNDQAYVMMSDRMPNRLKRNDEIYYEGEVFSLTSGTVALTIWGYKADGSYIVSQGTGYVISVSSVANISGSFKLTDSKWDDVAYYMIGFNQNGTGLRVRGFRAYIKKKGELLVDGSIVADHIKSLNGLNVGNGQFVVSSSGNVTIGGTLNGATGTFSGSLSSGSITSRSLKLTGGMDSMIFLGSESTQSPYYGGIEVESLYGSGGSVWYIDKMRLGLVGDGQTSDFFGDSSVNMNVPNLELWADRVLAKADLNVNGYMTVGQSLDVDGSADISGHLIARNGMTLIGHLTLDSNNQIIFDRDRVEVSRIYWNATPTTDYGMIFQVDGRTAMSLRIREKGTLNHPFLTMGNVALKGLNGSNHQLQVRSISDDGYKEIVASEFVTSSKRNTKQNFKEINENYLGKVKALKPKKYKLKTEVESYGEDKAKERLGLVLEEAPVEIVDGDGISLYAYTTMLLKAIQELSDEVEYLKKKLR